MERTAQLTEQTKDALFVMENKLKTLPHGETLLRNVPVTLMVVSIACAIGHSPLKPRWLWVLCWFGFVALPVTNALREVRRHEQAAAQRGEMP